MQHCNLLNNWELEERRRRTTVSSQSSELPPYSGDRIEKGDPTGQNNQVVASPAQAARMYQSSHPLQPEDQEIGIDPLQMDLGKEEPGEAVEDRRTNPAVDTGGTFLSYSREWEDLFGNDNCLARIRSQGINGKLRSSRFRSVCWKLFLNVLPQDRRQWISKTAALRTWYKRIKEIHITNPRKAAGQQDLMINNPLSQDEGSLWNRFFQDKELRAMIEQDVTRTFPEMQYFQQEDVRKILTDVLFCFARENEQLLYKQGMHELLAPILFILHCDHQAFQHASESASPSEVMETLLDPQYLEHDAYAVFSKLMETAEPWFSSFEHELQKDKDGLISTAPFARPQDLGPSIAIVTKVNYIQDQLLKKHDIELYMHLNRLEIAPQIYGLRWVRLLFGREFPLQDLLVVWDALFADGSSLHLVDYIFVAMLLYIRDALISSNYQTCLGLLMHYPPLGDVHSLILRALFLRDPKRNPRPINFQFQQNLDYYKARGADLMNKTRANTKVPPLNINKVSSSLLSFGRKLIAPAIAGGVMGPVAPTHGGFSTGSTTMPSRSATELPPQHYRPPQPMLPRMVKSESMPVHLSKAQCAKAASSSSVVSQSDAQECTGSPPLSASRKDSFFSSISRSRSQSRAAGKRDSEEELEAQISFLQGQLNDLEAMCKYCARAMNTHLGNIQDVILKEKLEKEDDILVSLAGLKQIKDILKGSLRFNQSLLEAEENAEITIADDHYCSQGLMEVQGEPASQVPCKTLTAPDAVGGPLSADSRTSDDYVLVSKEDEKGSGIGISVLSQLQAPLEKAARNDVPSPSTLLFKDPLMGSRSTSSSNLSSSPDDDSSNSKDSDFTIVSPLDI
ncbi:TBC1 domain family member 5 isoform X2 [Ambystoma mexicanum]|uniref:TBC1 domain family member 5 isoform X2 n=1 Tax=Ambystoma mexicanum TaxID=8296 RepID=UPI0037E825FC